MTSRGDGREMDCLPPFGGVGTRDSPPTPEHISSSQSHLRWMCLRRSRREPLARRESSGRALGHSVSGLFGAWQSHWPGVACSPPWLPYPEAISIDYAWLRCAPGGGVGDMVEVNGVGL